ncbi:hypothetical protein V2J09_003585 [Rumex salicifolius]
MASKFTSTVIHPNPLNPPKHIPSFRVSSSQRSNDIANTQDTSSVPGSARAQLDLLEQLTSSATEYGSDWEETARGRTIREQLAELGGGRDGEFSVPLGKNLKKFSAKFLTTSQKRNIKRQAYLNEVSQRNDAVFFSTVGAFVLVPPLLILAVAIATGYVQLFP